MQPFVQRLHINGGDLSRRAVDVLQVNMGRYCNQACIHCHVESGPTRNEMMSREAVEGGLGFLIISLRVGPDSSWQDRKSTRLNCSHVGISYAVVCSNKI